MLRNKNIEGAKTDMFFALRSLQSIAEIDINQNIEKFNSDTCYGI